MSGAGALLPGAAAAAPPAGAAAQAERDRAALLPTRHIPALDGLRAVAVLLVVASHAAPAHVVPGGFGVTLFFFISGYLLTAQFADEHRRTGRIGFAGFYLQRLLRLLPAALAFIAVSGLFFLAVGGSLSAAEWLSALLYGANDFDLFAGYRSSVSVAGTPGPVAVEHPFGILWSLAVEEHFYLLWPLTLFALLRWGGWRAAAAFLVALCLAELAWRAFLHPLCRAPLPSGLCGIAPRNRIYAATDTRFDALAFGALTAPLSAVSWYAIERPMLRLRRWAAAPRRGDRAGLDPKCAEPAVEARQAASGRGRGTAPPRSRRPVGWCGPPGGKEQGAHTESRIEPRTPVSGRRVRARGGTTMASPLPPAARRSRRANRQPRSSAAPSAGAGLRTARAGSRPAQPLRRRAVYGLTRRPTSTVCAS